MGGVAGATEAQTPVMRQYAEAKRQHPGALLLFRLGDFYELFYDDAVAAAQALQITLTARNKDKGDPIPMCGVPYHAAEGYIARLIGLGYKVALCDQMEDAKLAKTLVRREVTRVLTPGTAAFALAAGENRFLAAIARAPGGREGDAIGLAVLDVSTGEFRATEMRGEAAEARLSEELARWRPRELLYAAGAAGDAPLFRGPRPEELAEATLTPLEAWMLEPGFGQGVLESHFGVLTLEGFGLAGRSWAQAAAGAMVHYVKETQRSALAHVDRLAFYERQHGLVLDAVTVRNLELLEPLMAAPGGREGAEATLRAALDATVTAMGKRLLRQWLLRPSDDAGEIEARLEAVARLVGDFGRQQQLRALAAGIQDLERLLGRVALETALPRDLLALAASLERVPQLRGLLAEENGRLGELGRGLDGCAALRAAIAAHLEEDPPASLAEGGVIRAGIHAELDELRGLSRDAKGAIARIEARERERTTIASLKVRFNGVFGYFIEVSKPNLRLVPADYERKQTLVNAERFTTAELKELERKILSADERSHELERELFAALRRQAAEQAAAIRRDAAAVAELDVLANFAHLAAERNYCRPRVEADGRLEIVAGRHPVVERLGLATGERFVPNDLYLERETQRMLLLTGPNMGGKSTYLRQTALIAILAQMGSFVPAERARLPLFDRIFTRIGASDNLARGRSTFMVEMTEAAAILHQATPRSLVLLDEIGRGTATYDGLALAWAIAEHLHGAGPLTLFATHYHELTELARRLAGVRNARVAVAESEQGIVFLRKVEAGEANRSYGIEVARLAGLPPEVIERAREILTRHEAAAGGQRQLALPW
jgi:DNA mismatch repair protein MutS